MCGGVDCGECVYAARVGVTGVTSGRRRAGAHALSRDAAFEEQGVAVGVLGPEKLCATHASQMVL